MTGRNQFSWPIFFEKGPIFHDIRAAFVQMQRKDLEFPAFIPNNTGLPFFHGQYIGRWQYIVMASNVLIKGQPSNSGE